MVTFTLPPRGKIVTSALLKILRFTWALFVFVLRIFLSLLSFIFGSKAKRQTKPKDIYTQRQSGETKSLKVVRCNSQNLMAPNLNFEPVAYIVTLAKSEPHFNEKICALKERGYRWHSAMNAWALPKVRLGNSHPNFERIIAELKYAGYEWDGMYWRLDFPVVPSKPNSAY